MMQAKEVHTIMEEMRRMAVVLPGGHVSLEKAKALEEMLDLEAEKRRYVLRTLERQMMT